MAKKPTFWVVIIAPVLIAGSIILGLSVFTQKTEPEMKLGSPRRLTAKDEPPREMPRRFPPDTAMPDVKEFIASGSIDTNTFDSSADLVRVENDTVWWESDNDQNDDEDDHLMHRSMVAPLNRLIAGVCKAGGRLKIQEAYRPSRIHKNRSLHREGRAIDVTCDNLSLETLAKICWVSRFDWVYYEATGKGGEHVHCSIRR